MLPKHRIAPLMSTSDLIGFQQLEQNFRFESKLPDMHMLSKPLSKLALMELLFIITRHKRAHHRWRQ